MSTWIDIDLLLSCFYINCSFLFQSSTLCSLKIEFFYFFYLLSIYEDDRSHEPSHNFLVLTQINSELCFFFFSFFLILSFNIRLS
jgi:hypothetical protein